MFDQMFTAENFRRIYDAENRKGADLATRYFPTLEPLTLAVRQKVQEIRELRKNEATLKPCVFKAQLLALKAQLMPLKADKSSAVDSLMSNISQKVLKPSFKIDLTQKIGPKTKPVYCINEKPETFFVIKQIQRNIHRIYGVKQASRHDLVCQLRDMLGSNFPFELVRTDISSFYESIDRKRLLEKLDRDQLLSPTSKKYIRQILASYASISPSATGIPRGVGISAYLAELYLRPVDKAIRATPGLVLYCRFVDDIVAVFARPPAGKSLLSYEERIKEILSENGLALNEAKTSIFKLGDTKLKEFDYLGYRFQFNQGLLHIILSEAKMVKYQARMNASFADYWREQPVNSRGAFRKLVGRIKFLTGNTRLSNSKSLAATGIYFNNSIVNDLSSFQFLDEKLMLHIKELKRASLEKKLETLSFTKGFIERRYHNFSIRELQMIVGVWKHD